MKTSAVDKGRRSVDVMRGNVDAAAARSLGWVQELQNDTGSDILEGSVVVVIADGTIELADTENDPRPTGVVVDQIDDADTGQVVFGGPVDLVLVTASVTAGEYGQTSTTPGEAQVTGAVARAFCEFTSSGTEPSAFLWGGRGGGGIVAGVNIEDFPTTETDTALVLHPDGAGNVVWGVDATGGSSLQWFVVTDAAYGAVGDGTTDDTTAIAAAITAASAAGGIVYFPEGTYLISAALSVASPNVVLLGAGANASTILADPGLAAGDMIDISAIRCGVRDLNLDSALQKSGGIGIYLNGASDSTIQRVNLNNQYDSIKINGGAIIRIEGCNLYNQSRHGIWITGSGNDYYLSKIVADNSPVASGNGLLVDGGAQAIYGENCDFIHFTNGLLMQPSATSTWHFFTGMTFDTNDNDAIHLGSGAAQLRGVTFVNCWAASSVAGEGVYIGSNVEGVNFVGGKVLNNGQHGFFLDTGATRVTIADNLIVSNSQSATTTYSGIRVVAGITNLTITGNQAFNGWSLGNTQKYGLSFASGATDYLAIDANDFSGNVTGDIDNLAGVSGTHHFYGGQAGMTGGSATTYLDGSGAYSTPAGASFATPAIVLGTAAAAGAASTVIRSDSTIVAFDATAPVTQAFGDAAAVGTAAVAARRDHKHGMPASPSAGTLIGLKSYRLGSDTSFGATSSSTSADVDATNLSVVFTAPASTNVLVRLTCYGVNDTASKADYWQVRESTTVLADELVSNNETGGKRFTATALITGISGGSHTYKWGFRTSGGTYTLYGGPTFGEAVIEVWAAP